jgi:hypothetical protein
MLRTFREFWKRQRAISRTYERRPGVWRGLGPFSTACLLHVFDVLYHLHRVAFLSLIATPNPVAALEYSMVVSDVLASRWERTS